jgi:hypothetical protein
MEPAVAGLEKARHVLVLTGTPARNDVRDIDLFLRLLDKSELIAPLEPVNTTSNRAHGNQATKRPTTRQAPGVPPGPRELG